MKIVALVRTGRSLPLALGLGEVCAVALAVPQSPGESVLRAARAAGCVRAIAVWDEQLAATDYYGIAQTLACVARTVGFDVIVCSDGARGVLGPALADRLGIPHLSGVTTAALRGGELVAERASAGVRRAYAAAPPLLLSASPSARHADAPEGYAPIERLSLADVGISPAELRWRQRYAPHPMPAGPIARPLLFATAEELAQRLRDDGLLGAPDASDVPEGAR